MDFFRRIIDKEKKTAEENNEKVVQEIFEVPSGLSFVEIDRKTGLLAAPICLFPFMEVFLPGTEPTRFCTLEDHLMVFDYYSNKIDEEH